MAPGVSHMCPASRASIFPRRHTRALWPCLPTVFRSWAIKEMIIFVQCPGEVVEAPGSWRGPAEGLRLLKVGGKHLGDLSFPELRGISNLFSAYCRRAFVPWDVLMIRGTHQVWQYKSRTLKEFISFCICKIGGCHRSFIGGRSVLTAAGCQITVNTYFYSTRFSSGTSASLCQGVMEGLLTRCRALPALATCSHQLSQYAPQRFHHCAPGRGKRLMLSRMFQPQKLREDQVLSLEGRSGDLTCKSQRLMLQMGLIHPASPGCYHLLPYTVRAMEKLVRVIDQEMQTIGGQKVNMPSLSPAELWRATKRWDSMGRELLRLRDRHGKDYCLGPTHEEAITALVASQKTLSYKQLPFLLYQVTRKFRDEPRPRFGLLRGREFYMKDMYTFDSSPEAAQLTYSLVCDAYSSLFNRLGLRCIKVQADVGSIGGMVSHEFQLPVDVGEDRLVVCPSCHFSANMETLDSSRTNCPACQGPLTETKGIEVGHTFYLGTKYSSIFNAQFINVHGKPSLAEMGCYGLGVTRILAAAIEVLSTEDCVRWPGLLAPYQVCLIPPKKGSKEEAAAELAGDLYNHITEAVPQLQGEVLLDDRTHLTIGNRLKDANKLGYPFVIIAAKRALDDPAHFEVWCQNTGEVVFLTREGVLELLSQVQVV